MLRLVDVILQNVVDLKMSVALFKRQLKYFETACTFYDYRRVIWEESWKYIEEFNRTSGDKGSSYQISLNRIADRVRIP